MENTKNKALTQISQIYQKIIKKLPKMLKIKTPECTSYGYHLTLSLENFSIHSRC